MASRLRELGFGVFFAPDMRAILVGADGEALFKRLFAEAKEVVVFISAAYRARDWPRLEWDVILERPDRFIAVRLDDTKILGLSSQLFYVPFDGSNFAEIADTCIERLLAFERQRGIRCPTEYDRILAAMRDKSRGALPEAYQLMKAKRKRDPLGGLPWPDCQPRYRLFHERWANFSVVKRRTAKIALPSDLSRDQLRLQLEQACVWTLPVCRLYRMPSAEEGSLLSWLNDRVHLWVDFGLQAHN